MDWREYHFSCSITYLDWTLLIVCIARGWQFKNMTYCWKLAPEATYEQINLLVYSCLSCLMDFFRWCIHALKFKRWSSSIIIIICRNVSKLYKKTCSITTKQFVLSLQHIIHVSMLALTYIPCNLLLISPSRIFWFSFIFPYVCFLISEHSIFFSHLIQVF